MRLPRTVLPLLALAVLGLPASASADAIHVVAPGESLTSVAAADGLTVAQLAAANGLAPTAELLSGSELAIPPQGGSVETAGAPTSEGDGDYDSDDNTLGVGEAEPTAATPQQYVVQPGDTLTGIAARAGTSVEELAAANGINPNEPLLAGATITLSNAAAGVSAPTSASAATSQPVGVAAEGSPSEPPYPTPEVVSPAQISEVAAANGVPPSLANAIAYQESGFNNDLASSADARGVMQITPGTWSWINEALAPSPLAPESALANVRGGVLLLHSLLESAGGDEALAAAGYYQGLPSVLQNGVYPSTAHYVEDVLALQQGFTGE